MKDTLISGGELSALVAQGTITLKAAQETLTKLDIAIKQKMHVSVVLYQGKRTSIKVFPLAPKEADHINYKENQTLYVDPVAWLEAYRQEPLPA